MWFVPDALADAPRTLLAVGGGAAVLAILLWSWIAKRVLGRMLGRSQPAHSWAVHVVATAFSVLCASVAIASFMLGAALAGYRALATRVRVAEVQCIELQPGKLRLYFVPVERDGVRGPTRTFDLDGDEWTVGGEVLRFRPRFASLGLVPVAGVTRVEGRWHRAEDANAHKPTAYDLHEHTLGVWRWLQRNGTRGPLKWVIEGVNGSAVSQQADRRAVFDVMLTPNGYILDKRTL
jgi:hypothetical protein